MYKHPQRQSHALESLKGKNSYHMITFLKEYESLFLFLP
uniref:Uncharacterized protein n=1 Tax=Arundo donax TaxID=35708 RepID=A0A0A9EP08_ARUDO